MSIRRCPVLLVATVLSVLAMSADGAQPPARVRLLGWASAGSGDRVLSIDREALAAVSEGVGRILVEDVPLPSDNRVDLVLSPFKVTGPDTQFVIGRSDGSWSALATRPDVRLFRGAVADHPGSHVFLAFSDAVSMGSIDLGPGGRRYALASRAGMGNELAYAAPAGGGALPPGVRLCGLDALEPIDGTSPADPAAPQNAVLGLGTQTIKLAVETDYEFYELFGDLDAAGAYVVEMYAGVTDIYLRDVNARFELSFVRLWDTPNDLFNQEDPLTSFRDYWNANMSGVERDLAQFASGRRNLPYGGVAWLGTICSSLGYSVVGYLQGFGSSTWQPSVWNYDVRVTAHELGHNCATLHTHDYGIDICDDLNGPSRRGTIMAYCGQTRMGGNASQDVRFHADIQDIIESYVGSVDCVIDDCNRNGVLDSIDIAGAVSVDVNGNTVPDECEDCNENGILDPVDILLGASLDLNGNAIPDDCEPDCDGNGLPDDMDIGGGSPDLYGDNVPDSCDTDCDGSGVSDYNEILSDMTLDINRDTIPDACEDCDFNALTDAFELGGAHNLWVAGETLDVLGEFHAASGVRVKTSDAGHIAVGQDVVISSDGLVLVSSGLDDRVAAFDPVTGVYSHDFVAAGAGGLDLPAGMAIDANGDLLVSSFRTDAVLRYDGATGSFLGDFVAPGAGGLTEPFGLAFGPNGNLFVTGSDNQVREYDGVSGVFIDRFVKVADNGGLSSPRGLTFKRDGNLLVVSYASDAVLEYEGTTGAFVRKFNRNGTDIALTLDEPWGIRIGPTGNVIVARSGAGASGNESGAGVSPRVQALHLNTTRIFEFDVRTGNFVRSYVLGNDSNLVRPTGIAFWPGWDADCNLNALPDNCDINSGVSADADTDGVPDECQVDCNGNGTYDRLDIIPFGSSYDCNGNGAPDECDVASGESTDINSNGRPDECEGILAGDMDEDGDVDLFDYATFFGCVTGPDGGPIAPGCEAADFDGDVDVDMKDFAGFQKVFSG